MKLVMDIAEKIRKSEVRCGTWLSSGSAVIAELAASCGFDWVLLDMEHGCLTEEGVLGNLQAVSGFPVLPVVRVPEHDPALIGRLLDRGAGGIMVPKVSSAEEAKRLVSAMRYAPEGDRGYSTSVRAYGFGVRPANPKDVRPILMAQIETLQGVKQADQVAAVEGVDVLFAGPSDLKQCLAGVNGAPTYEQALQGIVSASRAAGIAAGILVRDMGTVPGLIQAGFSALALQSELGILRDGFLSTLHAAKTREATE